MYTRSFPSRRMPPDYSGTALVVKRTDEEPSSQSIFDEPSSNMRPRRTLISKPLPPVTPPISAPFGISGQKDAEESSATSDTPSTPDTDTALTDHIPKQAFFDPESLKSDDLLLLGIALMLLYNKDESGNIPFDALLIIAMLYLSGL